MNRKTPIFSFVGTCLQKILLPLIEALDPDLTFLTKRAADKRRNARGKQFPAEMMTPEADPNHCQIWRIDAPAGQREGRGRSRHLPQLGTGQRNRGRSGS